MKIYFRNHPFLLIIVSQQQDAIEARIRKIIENVGIARNAKDLLEQLQPIADALNKLQADTTSIADACHIWITLLETECLYPHAKVLKKRFEDSMTAEHYLAYCLHPKYIGETLNCEKRVIAYVALPSDYQANC